jgi:hypothetical protein
MSNKPEGKSKFEPNKKDTKISSADDLTKTKSGDVELDEEELRRVSGGGDAWDKVHYRSR